MKPAAAAPHIQTHREPGTLCGHTCANSCAQRPCVRDERQATNCASNSRSTFGIHSDYIRNTNRNTFGVCKSQFFETFALLKRRSLHPSFKCECFKSIAICILRMYSDWYSECTPNVLRMYSDCGMHSLLPDARLAQRSLRTRVCTSVPAQGLWLMLYLDACVVQQLLASCPDDGE